MMQFISASLFLMATELAKGVSAQDHFNVRPFHIALESHVPRMLNLAKETRLPESPIYPGLGSTAGIDTKVLNDLRSQWLSDFNWTREQKELNQFHHYLAEIEGQTIHYIHEKSSSPDAIPLMLLHGWPGSFLEFLPVIEPLTKKAKTSTGRPVSFNIIILGYKTFAVHGTDWGAAPAYTLYANYTKTVRAAHLAFLPVYPPTTAQIEAEDITLTPLEQFEYQRANEWARSGDGYFVEQTFQPNTIGLALQDSPVGQLSWIGEKMISWSDPRAGTPPSLITHNEILRSVSLYYLTQSFVSSAFIYFQNPNGFATTYTKAETDAPLFFSSFKYNVGFWPREFVEKVGRLVEYRNHDFGGHFPGLDNPPALIEDLRQFKEYWN
ncbi:hypothetical protein M409DRAFT_23926 [Zasmidium cellare ATCC 36951]|uniref:Epoxide hydrolase N-terminal domain-containing protein n=1 Tax=Zasmidium cellare ATCC 36951 TaxID=1080233 RepID=A0A6A6CET9_ZASCE|nr:uncharacterized protein M409DRAFT_23926 [Zasmidium cellare ATCC 36951]KAF2165635.1 hypothetical protein M409DRAFT_23926 [Zasmidium cellare ATCC 36951]